MSQVSPDASALLMCLSGPPQRADHLRARVGLAEQRFNAALSQLVNCYPAKLEVFGGAGEQYLVRTNSDFAVDDGDDEYA